MPRLALKEFGCGQSIATGTKIIAWIVMMYSVIGLYEINLYYYETKKIKSIENTIFTLLICNFVFGILTSISGFFGSYSNGRIWLKPFLIYLLSQFVVVMICVWIFFTLYYPELPTNPKKTRFMILNIILFVTVFFGLVAYSALNVYTHHRHISEEITGSELMVPIDENDVLRVHEDAFPSNMSSVSAMTNTRSYVTTTQINERHQRFLSNVCPPPAVSEENLAQSDSEKLINS